MVLKVSEVVQEILEILEQLVFKELWVHKAPQVYKAHKVLQAKLDPQERQVNLDPQVQLDHKA
jgi:hypothetical protein